MPRDLNLCANYKPTVRYCLKIASRIKKLLKELLLTCQPNAFKGYLRWRKKHFRIKKESLIKSY